MDRRYGMGSLTQDKRDGIWWISYYTHGVRHRESSHSREENDAVRLLRTRLKTSGDKQKTVRADRVTIEQLEGLIVSDYERNNRDSLQRVKTGFKDLNLSFRGQTAQSITFPALVEHMDQRLAKGRSLGSLKVDFAYLRRAFNLAILGGVLTTKPKFPTIDAHNVRKGFFEREQFDKVYAELPATIRPIAVMAYYTGWRVKDEILPLTWDRVDLRAGVIRLDPGTTKNKEGRTWPFDGLPELAEMLKAQNEETSALIKLRGIEIPWVFHRNGRQVKSIRTAWENACARAKVERYPHDFRRTAARNLMRAGVPQPVAKKLMGHKTDEMYERYAIVAEADLRESVQKLAVLSAGPATDAAHPR